MKFLKSPWMALIILFVAVTIRIEDPAFVESMRLRYFDTLIAQKPTTNNNIVIANIDEAAIEKYGQWPFKRDVYANMITELYNRGAGLVVFDVLMPETDRLGGDSVLAKTLADYPVILPAIPANISKNTIKSPGSAVLNPEYADRLVNYPGLISNINPLNENATGVGIVNTLPEIDGVNRRLPMIVGINNVLQPSITLEILRVASGDSTFQVKLSEVGVDKLRVPAFGPISTDPLGRIWIDWSQRSTEMSITALPNDLNGAIVIVGPAAAGISNPISTSVGEIYPHIVIGNVLGTLINNVNIQRPDWMDGAEILGIIILSIIALLFARFKYGFLVTISIAAGMYSSSIYLFNTYHYLVDPTVGIITVVLVYSYMYTVKFLTELNQKLQIKKQFGSYISPVYVEMLQKNPELLQLGGESQELTIYFSDIRSFTTISEFYKTDPTGLTTLITRYMDAMLPIIMANGGTVGKLIGDAIMCWWGSPIPTEKQASLALKTALELELALEKLNQELISENKPPLHVGAGINTGVVFIGNMGSKERFSYDILGDDVNIAARLEGQTKGYGVKLIISESTLTKYINENTESTNGQDSFIIELDIIAVKGKSIGVRIYTVLEAVDDSFYSAKTIHDEMINMYRTKKFNAAIGRCKTLKGSFGGQLDHYYEIWIQRCEEMAKKRLPKDWDGTYVATSK